MQSCVATPALLPSITDAPSHPNATKHSSKKWSSKPFYEDMLAVSLLYHLLWSHPTQAGQKILCLALQKQRLSTDYHRICPCRKTVSPDGRLVMMYTLPQLFGVREYLKEVSQQKIEAGREECLQRGPYPCDDTVFDICCLAMAENNLHPPTSPEEAIELYMFLCAYIQTQT